MDLLLTPYPEQVEQTQGVVSSKLFIDKTEVNKVTDPILKTAIALFPSFGDTPIHFLRESQCGQPNASKEDGFYIEIAENGVTIYAKHSTGFLYAGFTLCQIARQFPNEIPCMNIADCPVWKHRGAQVCYAQINLEYREEWLLKFVRELAEMRINHLYLYLEWRFQFASIPASHNDAYISPLQVKRLEKYCADYGITVIPQLNLLGHSSDFLSIEEYSHLKEYDADTESPVTANSSSFCPTNPQTRIFIEKALNDVMDVFSADIIHVGGDEVEKIGVCPMCAPIKEKAGIPAIYIEYFSWINRLLAKRNKKMGIWGDMISHYLGCNSYWGDKDQIDVSAFEELRDNTIIYDWSYDGPSDACMKKLSQSNFKFLCCTSTHNCSVGAPWPGQYQNQHSYFKDASNLSGCMGGVVTDWINGYSLHAEQSGLNYASAAALMWEGTGEDFTLRSSHDAFEQAYFFSRYGDGGTAMREYIYLAGSGKSPLLSLFPEKKNGSYLRKAAYLNVDPLYPYLHYFNFLQNGGLEKYADCVEQLKTLYETAIKNVSPVSCTYFQKSGLILHRYLLHKFSLIHSMYPHYRQAASLQYTDNKAFQEELACCVNLLKNADDIFTEPLHFLQECHRVLGLESGSVYRVEKTKENFYLLADYIENLSDSHRPLPSLLNISNWLFSPPATLFWEPRNDEWFNEKDEFRRYEIDGKYEWGSARW